MISARRCASSFRSSGPEAAMMSVTAAASSPVTRSIGHCGPVSAGRVIGSFDAGIACRDYPRDRIKLKRSVRHAASATNELFAVFRWRLGWLVIQVMSQPAFGVLQSDAFAQVIIQQLIAAQFADGEIFRIRMRKIKPAHAAPGPHGEAFGNLNAGVFLDVEQFPELLFFRVVRARGITGRG